MAIYTKAQTAALLHQMHPDIFPADDPTVKFVLTMWEKQDRDKKKWEFWYSCLEAGLPYNDYLATSCDVTQYDEKYKVDVEATTKVFARIIRWARSQGYAVRKEYESSTFDVYITLDDDSEYNFYTNRETMCTKRHVGTKVVPAVPETVVEEYEWNCEKIAFLGVDIT